MYIVIINPVTALNLGLQHWLSSMGTANKILLGLVLGGMMSVDMGGPVNKAAFSFGIAMISLHNYYPQAAIMAGDLLFLLELHLLLHSLEINLQSKKRIQDLLVILWEPVL